MLEMGAITPHGKVTLVGQTMCKLMNTLNTGFQAYFYNLLEDLLHLKEKCFGFYFYSD